MQAFEGAASRDSRHGQNKLASCRLRSASGDGLYTDAERKVVDVECPSTAANSLAEDEGRQATRSPRLSQGLYDYAAVERIGRKGKILH